MSPPQEKHPPREEADQEPLERTQEDEVIELRQEELVPHTEVEEVGEARIRTWIQEVPARLEVDAYSEEVEVEHVPVGQVVSERKPPWQEDDVLIVPIYEEQLVVSKRLVMREQIRVRRIGTQRRELFEDTLRRERVDIEDPQDTGLVHEQQPTQPVEGGEDVAQTDGGLGGLVRKALS
jgi:uncharacterized protein (TIGR02271 family)